MRTRAHRHSFGPIGAVILILALAAPASAAPPERVDEPAFLIFPDPANGLVTFWNITRDGYCAWEASDFAGDPPVTQLIPVSYQQTPTGAVIYRWTATSHLELWTLDEDADFSGPCQDTDGSSEPWAEGSARATNNDNDLFHDLSVEAGLKRRNAFGDHARGTVWDASGSAWHYGWVFKAQLDGELNFLIRADRTFLHAIR